jgi:hypothetical protein
VDTLSSRLSRGMEQWMAGFGNCTWTLTSRRRTLAAGYPRGAFTGGARATPGVASGLAFCSRDRAG